MYTQKTDNDAVLIHQAWPGKRNEDMLQLIEPRHQDYCDKYKFDLWSIKRSITDYPAQEKTWERLVLVKQAMLAGYKYIVWMDADAIIRDDKMDLRTACKDIGVCYDVMFRVHHYNCGVMYFENTVKIRDFVFEWHERYPGGLWNGERWHEQTEFNSMVSKYSTLIHKLDNCWNSYPTIPCPADKVIVRAWHGPIMPDEKYRQMSAYINSLPSIENQ
jgi:hypothetical protein